eukprot:2144007-Rhodomonas_salina.1
MNDTVPAAVSSDASNSNVLDMREVVKGMGYTQPVSDKDLRTLGIRFSNKYFELFGVPPPKGSDYVVNRQNHTHTPIAVNEYTANHLGWIKPIITNYFQSHRHAAAPRHQHGAAAATQQTIIGMWRIP